MRACHLASRVQGRVFSVRDNGSPNRLRFADRSLANFPILSDGAGSRFVTTNELEIRKYAGWPGRERGDFTDAKGREPTGSPLPPLLAWSLGPLLPPPAPTRGSRVSPRKEDDRFVHMYNSWFRHRFRIVFPCAPLHAPFRRISRAGHFILLRPRAPPRRRNRYRAARSKPRGKPSRCAGPFKSIRNVRGKYKF